MQAQASAADRGALRSQCVSTVRPSLTNVPSLALPAGLRATRFTLRGVTMRSFRGSIRSRIRHVDLRPPRSPALLFEPSLSQTVG